MLSIRTAVRVAITMALALGVGAAVEPELASSVKQAAVKAGGSARTGLAAVAETATTFTMGLDEYMHLETGSGTEPETSSGSEASARTDTDASAEIEAGADSGSLLQGSTELGLEAAGEIFAEGFLDSSSR